MSTQQKPKNNRGTTNQQVKKSMEKGNLDVPRIQYKVIVLFLIKKVSLTLCQGSDLLQDTALTKLLGQFIEVHNTQLYKRLQQLT